MPDMPDSTLVQPPAESEQVRLLAAAIADLEAVVSIVVENRDELLPGEAADELLQAWSHSRQSFNRLAQDVLRAAGPPVVPTPAPSTAAVTVASLQAHHLIGPVGAAKRSMLSRLRDAFRMYWHTLPRTDDRRTKAAAAAIDLFEYGASIAGSIPGGGVVEEALLLFKQAVTVRYRRGF
jgi:hypothetical protein